MTVQTPKEFINVLESYYTENAGEFYLEQVFKLIKNFNALQLNLILNKIIRTVNRQYKSLPNIYEIENVMSDISGHLYDKRIQVQNIEFLKKEGVLSESRAKKLLEVLRHEQPY